MRLSSVAGQAKWHHSPRMMPDMPEKLSVYGYDDKSDSTSSLRKEELWILSLRVYTQGILLTALICSYAIIELGTSPICTELL